ncbi:amidohydrolase [Propionibacteriaceae bacterium Y2011]
MNTDGNRPYDDVLDGLDGIRAWQQDTYRQLHQHPELSFQEVRTAALAADRLRQSGYEVHEQVGGTGVVGILRNGDGPGVLLRADMDALPVREETGLPYASTDTATDDDGIEVPVMHACGHDVHVTALLGAATLLAMRQESWSGTVVALFQPAEELGTGARRMVDDGLGALLPHLDVALGQHVLAFPAGEVRTRPGLMLTSAASVRITLHGRGAHGSMPDAAVDPVVLAAMIIIRLQTVVSRELPPSGLSVVTVGSVHAGSKANVIDSTAVLEVNVRTDSDTAMSTALAAIERMVVAECRASATPADPEIEVYGRYPATSNDPAATERVRTAFDTVFGDAAGELAMQSASEDFSIIPDALGIPYCYWAVDGADPSAYAKAVESGRIAQDVPVNHSPFFAPVMQPTLDVGTRALTTAALAWLAAG